MLPSLLRRALHRPAQPLVFSNHKYLLYVHTKARTTVRVLTAGTYGVTGWLGWRLLTVGMGWAGWGVHSLAFFIGLRLCMKANNSGKVFVSEMNLLSDGKTVELRNSGAVQVHTTVVCTADIQVEMRPHTWPHYISFATKQGDKFVLSAQGHIADKALLKVVLAGEDIDLRHNESSEIIDI